MRTLTVTVEDALFERVAADARRRGVGEEQAASDLLHRRLWEAQHGPIADEDLAELDAAMIEADRGEFAADGEVDAFFSRYGA